jgi:hypothetical protein
MGFYSKVVLSGCGMKIVNPFFEHYVPWGEVEEVGSASGGFSVLLKEGREIGSIQYGSSLVGEIFGYRSHRKIVEASRRLMSNFRSRGGCSREEKVDVRVKFPVVRVFLILLAYQSGSFLFLVFSL